MVDFHSHALPGIDDGATDVAMSAAMLKLSKKQGADTVVLTPHYYFSCKSVDEFIAERDKAFDSLCEYSEKNSIELPKLIKGAEVKFSYELLDLEELDKLCIENTNALLLEMPFSHWNPWIFDKLFEVSASKNIHFIIAHAERYINSKKEIKRLTPLFNMNCTIQINSDSFAKLGKRGLLKCFVNEGRVHLIGSDMHNNTTRKSTLDKAYKYIRKKYGEKLLNEISANEKNILKRVDN